MNLTRIYFSESLQLADYIPILSTFKNSVDIYNKYARTQHDLYTQANPVSSYYDHLEKKSYSRCIILLVPVLGNIAIYCADRLSAISEKRNASCTILITTPEKEIEIKPDISICEIQKDRKRKQIAAVFEETQRWIQIAKEKNKIAREKRIFENLINIIPNLFHKKIVFILKNGFSTEYFGDSSFQGYGELFICKCSSNASSILGVALVTHYGQEAITNYNEHIIRRKSMKTPKSLAERNLLRIEILLTHPHNVSSLSNKEEPIQARGVGSALIYAILQRCILTNSALQFETTDSAASFYKKLGFTFDFRNQITASSEEILALMQKFPTKRPRKPA